MSSFRKGASATIQRRLLAYFPRHSSFQLFTQNLNRLISQILSVLVPKELLYMDIYIACLIKRSEMTTVWPPDTCP